jgi:hypothetical protein
MKVLWPFGVALRGEASSRLDTALAEDFVNMKRGTERGIAPVFAVLYE